VIILLKQSYCLSFNLGFGFVIRSMLITFPSTTYTHRDAQNIKRCNKAVILGDVTNRLLQDKYMYIIDIAKILNAEFH